MRSILKRIGYFKKYTRSSSRKRVGNYAIHTERDWLFLKIYTELYAQACGYLCDLRGGIGYFFKYCPSSTRKLAVSYTIHTCLRFGYIL